MGAREEGGGGVHFLYKTYFGGSFLTNSNLEGVRFLLSFFINFTPTSLFIINEQSLNACETLSQLLDCKLL